MKFREVRFKRRHDCPSCSGPRTGTLPPQKTFRCASALPSQPRLAEEFYILPQALQKLMPEFDENQVLLDVRDSNELEGCQLPGVVHIPLGELDVRLAQLDREQTHYLICYGGVRAERAAVLMQKAGFAKTVVLEGGMKRWVRDIDQDMPIY